MEEGVEKSKAGNKVESFQSSGNSHASPGKRVVKRTSSPRSQSPSRNGSVKTIFSHKERKVKIPVPQARWLFWSAAFVLTATVSATLGATVALMTPLASIANHDRGNTHNQSPWSKGFGYHLSRPVNILVMGIDRVLDVPDNSPKIFNGNSDAMLLLRIDPSERSVKMLSIPRDTRVEIPGFGINKINQANVDGGAILAAKTVSHTLNNVPIDRYVRITTSAFRELVDLVGGVEVFVPERMSYVDNTQNLKIDLDQGWQTLDGDRAEQFARFRHDSKGDIGRVQRQQALLTALRQRLMSPTVLPRVPQLLQAMSKHVDTNLSIEEMLALANFGLGLEQDNFKMVLLPGRFSTPREYYSSFWIMDTAGKDKIVSQYFPQNSKKPSSLVSLPPAQLRIAIQNASSQPMLSQRVASALKQKGFSHVYIVQDWPDTQRQTEIIVQKGDLKAASTIKQVLGTGKVEADSTGDIQSDLTIRVGQDWQD